MFLFDYLAVYTEIGIFCTLAIFFVGIKTAFGVGVQKNRRSYTYLLFSIMIFLLCDVIWHLAVGGLFFHFYWGLYTIRAIYYVVVSYMCYRCFDYYEHVLDSSYAHASNRKKAFSLIFVFIEIVIMFVNAKTGTVFSFDEHLMLQPEKLYFLVYFFSYIYVTMVCVRTLHYMHREDSYGRQEELFTYAVMPIVPTICGIIEIFFPWLPLLSVSMTLAVIVIYINSLEQLISKDALTGLNNKRQFIRDVTSKIKVANQGQSDEDLYLLMLDLDLFKEINDTYGHDEGDKALETFADLLRQACANLPRRASLARFGGDEFVILIEVSGSEEEQKIVIEDLCTDILEQLRQYNEDSPHPYQLLTSIGAARYETSMRGMRDFVAFADENMYHEKKKKHIGRNRFFG